MSEEMNKKPKPITRASLSVNKMEAILKEGIENKTILKKEKNAFVNEIKKIQAEQISKKEQLVKIKDKFWDMFSDRISPRKKVKQEDSLYRRFADIGEKKE